MLLTMSHGNADLYVVRCCITDTGIRYLRGKDWRRTRSLVGCRDYYDIDYDNDDIDSGNDVVIDGKEEFVIMMVTASTMKVCVIFTFKHQDI